MGVYVNGVPVGAGDCAPAFYEVDGVVGTRVTGGFDSVTSDYVGAGDVLSITVSGDGSHRMEIKAYCRSLNASAAGWAYLTVSRGSGTIQQAGNYIQTSGAGANVSARIVVEPFTGSDTFVVAISSGGTPTAKADATYPMTLEAVWASA